MEKGSTWVDPFLCPEVLSGPSDRALWGARSESGIGGLRRAKAPCTLSTPPRKLRGGHRKNGGAGDSMQRRLFDEKCEEGVAKEAGFG